MRVQQFCLASRCLLSILTATAALAVERGIGVVTSPGEFLLNQQRVAVTATLEPGSSIEALAAPSRLVWKNGVELELAPGTRVVAYEDHVSLEKGFARFRTVEGFAFEAAGFRVRGTKAGAVGLLALQMRPAVQVAAQAGTLEVLDHRGLLLATVVPGAALQLEPQQPGPAPPSIFSGCLMKKQDRFVLYDEVTRLVVEVRGPGLEAEWGNRVQVVGTTDTTATSPVGAQVVDVSTLTRLATGGCDALAQSLGAQVPSRPAVPQPPKPAPQARAGMSAGAKVAIIGAIAGGAGAGVFLATKKEETRSP